MKYKFEQFFLKVGTRYNMTCVINARMIGLVIRKKRAYLMEYMHLLKVANGLC